MGAAHVSPEDPIPTPTLYVGIDVHQATHHAALLTAADLDGGRWTEAATDLPLTNDRASFDSLLTAIAAHAPDPAAVAVAVDYTGGHYSAPLVHLLATAGFTIDHVQPQALNAIRQKLLGQENKTDPTDAAAMAHVLYLHRRHGIPLRVSPVRTDLTSAAAVMRAYLAQAADVKRARTAALNRLHQYWTATFPEGERAAFQTLLTAATRGGCVTPADVLASDRPARVRAERWTRLQELAAVTVGVPPEPYRPLLLRSAADVRRTTADADALDAELAAAVARHPHGPLFTGLPGVGANTAAVVISTTEDPTRYPTPQAYRRALGVYSTLKSSGAGRPTAPMGHGGSRAARSALWRAALTACTHPTAQPQNHPLRRWYTRRTKDGKMPKRRALSAVSGKLAEHLWAIGRSGQPWQNRP